MGGGGGALAWFAIPGVQMLHAVVCRTVPHGSVGHIDSTSDLRGDS